MGQSDIKTSAEKTKDIQSAQEEHQEILVSCKPRGDCISKRGGWSATSKADND